MCKVVSVMFAVVMVTMQVSEVSGQMPNIVPSVTFLGDDQGQATEVSGQMPNVVLIPLDDSPYLGDEFFGMFPNFKELFLDQGLSFRQVDGNDPLCCPGRANILTGQESQHHGVVRLDARLLDPRVTIATELNALGYYTFMVGKYLNNSNLLADKTPVGWDRVAMHVGAYFNYTATVDGKDVYQEANQENYSVDFDSRKSIEFLEEAPQDQPVFAYIAPYAIHFGKDERGVRDHLMPVPAPRHRGDPRCNGVPRYEPANFNEANVSDKPTWVRKLSPLGSFYTGGYPTEKFCETMLSVDELIGKVVDELKRQGRYENTLFIVTSDNGWGGGSHRWLKKIAPYTTQIPMYVSWPGVTSSEQIDMQISNVDIAPTICDLAGCRMGPFHNGFPVDGQSFAGLIAPHLSSAVPNRTAILMQHILSTHVPRWKSIRTASNHPLGLWHYIWYPGTGEKELYDVSGGPCLYWRVGMSGDPCELNNLAGKSAYRNIRNQLHNQLLREW